MTESIFLNFNVIYFYVATPVEGRVKRVILKKQAQTRGKSKIKNTEGKEQAQVHLVLEETGSVHGGTCEQQAQFTVQLPCISKKQVSPWTEPVVRYPVLYLPLKNTRF